MVYYRAHHLPFRILLFTSHRILRISCKWNNLTQIRLLMNFIMGIREAFIRILVSQIFFQQHA